MNNTALRAEAQSADNTHMVFANEEHEKFYYEKLELFKTQAAGTQKQTEIKEKRKEVDI